MQRFEITAIEYATLPGVGEHVVQITMIQSWPSWEIHLAADIEVRDKDAMVFLWSSFPHIVLYRPLRFLSKPRGWFCHWEKAPTVLSYEEHMETMEPHSKGHMAKNPRHYLRVMEVVRGENPMLASDYLSQWFCLLHDRRHNLSCSTLNITLVS